jgi:Bacterial PH domain
MILTALRAVVSAARWLVRMEIGIWRSLFLWMTRRIAGQGPGVRPFAYSKAIVPVLAVFIFVSVLELPVVHLLLPWDSVRLVAVVLSVWGLLWMVGYLASMKVFPHLLDDDGVRVRYGTNADIAVPWEAIASVRARRRSVATGKHLVVERTEDATVLNVAVFKQTKVDVVLREPTTLELPEGPEEITEVRLAVDDPRAFVSAACERLAAEPTARRR